MNTNPGAGRIPVTGPQASLQQRMGPSMRDVPNLKTRFFNYSLQFLGVTNGASATQQLTIQADSDFLITQMIACSTDASYAPITNDGVLVQFTDTGSGMNFYDQAQPLINVAGSAQLPYVLATPLLMKKNASLQGSLTNNTGATGNFYVTFAGYRIYQ